ncbi:hypothetical protein HYPSUDRAFT_813561 [Hypholoma sublateritium FD-334 SS-4]|uniref:Uncharacterized protein n=1 Tax=Hypholoma sublateritium (strain FD-334 SS-4) TaxID=945553 RepID=A0A0D2NV68_HYPSF|nr:hypothetical protein HYPSUDRAFT_813561 [Hypholoma sublateritium FD-334 SS-4]
MQSLLWVNGASTIRRAAGGRCWRAVLSRSAVVRWAPPADAFAAAERACRTAGQFHRAPTSLAAVDIVWKCREIASESRVPLLSKTHVPVVTQARPYKQPAVRQAFGTRPLWHYQRDCQRVGAHCAAHSSGVYHRRHEPMRAVRVKVERSPCPELCVERLRGR